MSEVTEMGLTAHVARVISSGRHTGEFIGFQPTGKTFAVEQIHIYRIAEDKIIEHWSSRDDLSQGMQLGCIPAGRRPEPAAAGLRGTSVAEMTHPPSELAGKRLAKTSDISVGGGKILAADRVVITQPQSRDIQGLQLHLHTSRLHCG